MDKWRRTLYNKWLIIQILLFSRKWSRENPVFSLKLDLCKLKLPGLLKVRIGSINKTQQTVALSSMSTRHHCPSAAHSLGTWDISVHLFQDSPSLEARPRSPSRGDWNYFQRMDGVFSYVKTESIFAPASPTRHRLGCPSRTPALRHHSGSGAKDSLLTSLVFGESSEQCSSSSACGKRRLEKKTRPFSGTRPLHRHGGECSDLQRWIWSFVVPYLIFACLITL